MIDFTEGMKEFNTKNFIENLITANTNKFRYYQSTFEVEEVNFEDEDEDEGSRRLMSILN